MVAVLAVMTTFCCPKQEKYGALWWVNYRAFVLPEPKTIALFSIDAGFYTFMEIPEASRMWIEKRQESNG